MRRLTGFVAGPVFLITAVFVLVTILLSLVVNDLKAGQPAIVHLKGSIAGSNERDGDVTKSDKYVTVKSQTHGKEIFAWEQIDYISEKDASTSRRLDRVVDLIDLLSKFGLVATVLFFMVGLFQYSRTQKWEREKFLSAEIKEFVDRKPNLNAMQLIDSWALYPKGRWVELFPEKENAEDKKVFVKNEEIYVALTTTPDDLDDKDPRYSRYIAIRECFDTFLSYMVSFNHYVNQDLITLDALSAHIGYWFSLMGPKGNLAAKYKQRTFAYAKRYEMTDFEELVKKYNKPTVWGRIREFFYLDETRS